MKGLSIDEIVNSQILNNSKKVALSPKNETISPPDRSSINEGGMFSGNNSPNNRDSHKNNRSNLSMGMTQK